MKVMLLVSHFEVSLSMVILVSLFIVLIMTLCIYWNYTKITAFILNFSVSIIVLSGCYFMDNSMQFSTI